MRKLLLPLVLASCHVAALAGPAVPDPRIQEVLARVDPAAIQKYVEKLVSFGTRHTLSDTVSQTRGIGAARRWIRTEMENCAAGSAGRMTVSLDEHTRPAGGRTLQPVSVVNVVATLKGTAVPERVLVVSGHYDSRASDVMDATGDAPGANDDASGSAAVIAMACAFAPLAWPTTLVFMNVAAEEQGLWGAEHWAELASQQHRNIIGMLNNDVIGSPLGDQGQHNAMQVRLFASGGGDDTPTNQLGRYLKDAAESYLPGFQVKLINRRDRFLRGGDHLPFLEHGFAAVRFTEPVENFSHQHQDVRVQNGVQMGDLAQFVDYDYVARVARANAAGLASLALAPPPPEAVGIEVRELTNDTRLVWHASKSEPAASYRIQWREPGFPQWQFSQDVGQVTAFTLKGVSKDNFVFGVAAVNATGQASLPVFPQPVR